MILEVGVMRNRNNKDAYIMLLVLKNSLLRKMSSYGRGSGKTDLHTYTLIRYYVVCQFIDDLFESVFEYSYDQCIEIIDRRVDGEIAAIIG